MLPSYFKLSLTFVNDVTSKLRTFFERFPLVISVRPQQKCMARRGDSDPAGEGVVFVYV